MKGHKIEIYKGKIDEIEVSHLVSETGEGYEITIDQGNGTYQCIIIYMPKGGKPIISLEKYWDARKEDTYIETNMKVMYIRGNSFTKLMDGRYKITKTEKDPVKLHEKIKNEGLPFIALEKVS